MGKAFATEQAGSQNLCEKARHGGVTLRKQIRRPLELLATMLVELASSGFKEGTSSHNT